MASQFTFGDSFLNAYIGAQQRAQQQKQYETEMAFKRQQADQAVKQFNQKFDFGVGQAKMDNERNARIDAETTKNTANNMKYQFARDYTTEAPKGYAGDGVDAGIYEAQYGLGDDHWADGVKLYNRNDIKQWDDRNYMAGQLARVNSAISAQNKPPTAGQTLAGRKQGLQWNAEASTWEPIPEAKLPTDYMDIQLPNKDSFLPTDNMSLVGEVRKNTGLAGGDLLEAVQKVQQLNKQTNLGKFDETVTKYKDMLKWMEENPNSPEAQYQFLQYFDPIQNEETGNVEGIRATSLLGNAMKSAGYDDKTIENKLRELTIKIVTNPVYQSRVQQLGK